MSEKKSRERLEQERRTDEDKATLSYSDRRQKTGSSSAGVEEG